jgi:hypothetical protein
LHRLPARSAISVLQLDKSREIGASNRQEGEMTGMRSCNIMEAFPNREDTLCRSIKVLRKSGQPAAPEELNAAALQFVRKISGYHHPSRINQEAFDLAIREIAATSKRLLDSLAVPRRASASKGTSASDSSGADSSARFEAP